MRRLTLVLLLLIAGCGGSPDRDTSPFPAGGRDCFAVWNGDGNEDNRSRIADEGFGVARVGGFIQHADFGEGATEEQLQNAEKEGCSYLFHDDHRHLSLSGTWEDEGIRWGTLPPSSGPWSPDQEANSDDNASVAEDGTLRKRDAAEPPAGREPAPPTEGPPPAWIETDRGSFWLGFSTYCWKSGCADYVAPSCTDAKHVPTIKVRRGELVTVHIGFEPREVTLTYFPEQPASQKARDQERLHTRRDPVWRVQPEGAFSLFAIAKQGGDASYAGCLELD